MDSGLRRNDTACCHSPLNPLDSRARKNNIGALPTPTVPMTNIPAWTNHPRDAGETILAHEILAERAASMGAAAERVTKTLQALQSFAPEAEGRVAALKDATEAVWMYFIQRELCGFRRHDDVIRDHAIPREVLNRLGAR